ncbi:hypothetical protein AAMO2058_000827300 [Amorphochlora amoebiformis]
MQRKIRVLESEKEDVNALRRQFQTRVDELLESARVLEKKASISEEARIRSSNECVRIEKEYAARIRQTQQRHSVERSRWLEEESRLLKMLTESRSKLQDARNSLASLQDRQLSERATKTHTISALRAQLNTLKMSPNTGNNGYEGGEEPKLGGIRSTGEGMG